MLLAFFAEIPRETIIILITSAMACGGTFVLIKGLDRLRRRDAESEARQIVGTAEQEARTLRRETELELKEKAIQQKAEGERELRKLREELHERERILDKRQDVLEKQAEQLQKQEKIVEGTQRKLTERIQDTNRRQAELSKLLDLQRQTLHELSGLNREEATTRLLTALDGELTRESGAVIMKHAVPNALHPLVAYQGVALPYMLTGEIEVAIVFGLATVGPAIVGSMGAGDVYVTATFMLVLAATLIVGNIISDVLLVALDPRVRLGGGSQ